jgi:hypothetical protein
MVEDLRSAACGVQRLEGAAERGEPLRHPGGVVLELNGIQAPTEEWPCQAKARRA